MKTTTHHLKLVLGLTVVLVSATPLLAQTPVGQWDFNSSNLVATVGTDLAYGPDGGVTQSGTQFGTTTSFGIPNINGSNAVVMLFPAATNGGGYMMSAPSNPNGGGTEVNVWTLIMDVLYPASSDNQIRPIIDTDGSLFVAGPDFIVSASDGIGSPPNGPYDGLIASNTWYRLGIVVTNTQITYFINGLQVGTVPNVGCSQFVDCRYALTPTLPTLILGTTDTNAASGYVNSIQLWDVNLNAGQMLALGGATAAGIPTNIPPVPSFIQSRTPDVNAVGVAPIPAIDIVLSQGNTTVTGSSIQLMFDGAPYPISVNATPPTFDVKATLTNILDPTSVHTLSLLWTDSVAGANTNTWSFTVMQYQSVTLPAPFYLETFDEVAEGGVPTGWVATNATSVEGTSPDLCSPNSSSYENWLVINTNRLCGYTGSPCPGFECDTLDQPPVVVNGVLLDSLAHSNFLFFESDNRCNGCYGQVGMLFSSDIDCSGKTNVFVSWHSLYTQNQDSIGSLEYSIDQGTNWLPVLYYLDGQSPAAGGTPDVIWTNGVVDVGATFNTPRSDQPANGTNYGYFIGAPVTAALIPYVVGATNDDQVSGKAIQTVRLSQADGQSHVRFRFAYAGTCSWYWGVDDFGLYEINTPVITTQPLTQTIDAGTPVTFSVAATSASPLRYQWVFNGHNIAGATNSSYTLASVATTDAGQYQVVVINSDGTTKSSIANLTVITLPHIDQSLISQVADAGANITFAPTSGGAHPITYIWLFNGSPLSGSNAFPLSLPNVQVANSGDYQLIITNSYGAVTSSIAQLTVVSGPITNNLVAHLTFDGNFNDTSGRGNNAQYAHNGSAADPNPTFVPGKIGQAFQYTTLIDGTKYNYATFGYPSDLKFDDTVPFSVSMWLNYTNQADDPPYLSNKDWNSSGNPGWGIFCQGGGNFRVQVTGTNLNADKFSTSSTPSIRDGNWNNVVVSFMRAPLSKAGYVSSYVDGVLVNQSVMVVLGNIDTDTAPFTNEQGVPSSQTSFQVNIGQDGTGVYHDQGSAFNIAANIDDLGIWRRALTAGEAAAIFAAGQAGKDLSQAVVNIEPGPAISLSQQGNSWVITYTGTLYSSSTVNGTYAPVSGATSPYTIPIGAAPLQFYRSHQ